MRRDALERRSIEERRRQDMQGVEPSAGLPVVLDDEITRVMGIEPLGVLERVMHLRERHRTRLEPAVEDLRHATHRRLPGRIVRVGSGQLIDHRPVQIIRAHAEIALQLVEGTVDVEPGILGVVGHPRGDRTAPVAVPADVPVTGTLEPLTELAVADVLGNPGDLLVQFDHAVAEPSDSHEP